MGRVKIMMITVIDKDNLIVVDGQGLSFSFPKPFPFHAIQWDDFQRTGHIEFGDARPNKILGDNDYDQMIRPFVAAFGKEIKVRMSCPGPDYDRQGDAWVLNGERQSERERDELLTRLRDNDANSIRAMRDILLCIAENVPSVKKALAKAATGDPGLAGSRERLEQAADQARTGRAQL